MNNRKHWTLNY